MIINTFYDFSQYLKYIFQGFGHFSFASCYLKRQKATLCYFSRLITTTLIYSYFSNDWKFICYYILHFSMDLIIFLLLYIYANKVLYATFCEYFCWFYYFYIFYYYCYILLLLEIIPVWYFLHRLTVISNVDDY